MILNTYLAYVTIFFGFAGWPSLLIRVSLRKQLCFHLSFLEKGNRPLVLQEDKGDPSVFECYMHYLRALILSIPSPKTA